MNFGQTIGDAISSRPFRPRVINAVFMSVLFGSLLVTSALLQPTSFPRRCAAPACNLFGATGKLRTTNFRRRSTAPTDNLFRDASQLVFGKSLPTPAEAQKTQNLLGLMSRAAASRGKADIDALRAFASIVGFGGEIEGMLGVSNSSDPSGEMIEKALSGLGSAVASKLESPKERRIKLALSVTLAILLCELAQLTIVLTASWLFGAGVSAAPRGLLPFGAALGVALQSRALTRPLRLVAEAWATVKVRKQLSAVPPGRRPLVALRGALLAIGAVAAFCALLTKADAYLCMRGQGAATSIYGVQMLRGYGDAPLARLARALAALLLTPTLTFLMKPIGLAQYVVQPGAVGASAAAGCAFVRARARDAAAASQVLSEWAMTVKPLRAMLELSETDDWIASNGMVLYDKVRGLF